MMDSSANPLHGWSPDDWHVICDFDGTITPFDVTDALLTAFAAPEWETVENDWIEGRLTARECMAAQVALLNTPMGPFDDFLDNVPLTQGFAAFIEGCETDRLPLTVVSDGMDYAIRRVLTRHGLGHLPVLANALKRAGDTGFMLGFPHGAPDCSSGMCKCRVARTFRASGKRLLLIGDGRSDCCVASEVDMVLAKNGQSLHAHCLKRGIPVAPFATFHDVLMILRATQRQIPILPSPYYQCTVHPLLGMTGR